MSLELQRYFRCVLTKKVAYRRISEKYFLNDNEIAYVGDDIVDIPLLKRAGFSVVVADADNEVKTIAMMITKMKGGRGAVREVCDFILKAKGLWQDIIDEYSKT